MSALRGFGAVLRKEALQMVRGQRFETPIQLVDGIFDELFAYAVEAGYKESDILIVPDQVAGLVDHVHVRHPGYRLVTRADAPFPDQTSESAWRLTSTPKCARRSTAAWRRLPGVR